MRTTHHRSALHVLAPALLATALYAVTLGGTYVFDDRYIIQTDPRLTPPRWQEFWTKDYFNGAADNLYRPLVSMSYAIQVWLHGASESRAWLFHAVNILLHAAVTATLAEMTHRLTGSTRIALIAALLFAAHPVHVEAVANIVGRAELMCALGVLGAVTLLLERPLTTPRAIGIWLCLILALLSKEQGMLLPLLLLLTLSPRYSGERAGERGSVRKEREVDDRKSTTVISYAQDAKTRCRTRFSTPTLLLILLITWTTALYLILREQFLRLRFWWDRNFLDWTINPIVLSAGRDRILLPLVLLGHYAVLLIAPHRLSLDYGAGVIDATVNLRDPHLYLGAAALIAWIVACVFALIRRNRIVLFALLAFALFYGLIGNIVTLIGINLAERLMYLPSAFFCIFLALMITKFRPRAQVAIVAIVLILYSARTLTYAARWNDRLVLYETTLREHPHSVRLHLLLADELDLRHDPARAETVMAEAREQFPQYWKVWEQSALIALDSNDLPAAERFYARAEALHPSMRASWLAKELSTRRAATKPATMTVP